MSAARIDRTIAFGMAYSRNEQSVPPNLRLHLTRLSCSVAELAGPATEVSAGGTSPRAAAQVSRYRWATKWFTPALSPKRCAGSWRPLRRSA